MCRRWLVSVVGLLSVAVGVTAQSQYPIFTPDDFTRTMKTIGQNFGSVSPAIASNDMDGAKALAIRAREQLATTITFWRKRGKDDAVAALRTTTAKFDELDNVLSKSPVDKEAVSALSAQIAGGCQSCHARYRERDPATNAYRFTASALQ